MTNFNLVRWTDWSCIFTNLLAVCSPWIVTLTSFQELWTLEVNRLKMVWHFQCTQVSERHQQGQSWFWDSREAIRSEPFESLGYRTRSQTSLGRGHFWVWVIDVGGCSVILFVGCIIAVIRYTWQYMWNDARRRICTYIYTEYSLTYLCLLRVENWNLTVKCSQGV